VPSSSLPRRLFVGKRSIVVLDCAALDVTETGGGERWRAPLLVLMWQVLLLLLRVLLLLRLLLLLLCRCLLLLLLLLLLHTHQNVAPLR
jgi:hypothetical protein